jgi:hypothetical protein
MTNAHSNIPGSRDLGCAIWFVITLAVILLYRQLSAPPTLFDYPSERSHPEWKSSINICLSSNRMRTTRV